MLTSKPMEPTMKPSNGWPSRAIAAVALIIMVSACTDETIVFRERELFETPPTAALGFLGYTDQDTKLTVCGNCHVGVQAQWENTAHADAWNGLQDSGGAQAFCEGCHTTNDFGNTTTQTGGYNAIPEARYQDVQCEACHGPGIMHVTNPDASQPFASIAVGAELESGCGQCHSGAHHAFLEDWAGSRHGFAASSYARGREACQSCHEGKAALVALGVDANYLEKGSSEVQPIGCAVCHDPHGSPNDAQLRFPIDVPNVEQNLCMKCHQKRAVPDLGPDGTGSSTRGPHSPQGPLLLGEDVGWIPPNFAYSNTAILGTHGTDANPRLCATCHVSSREITDELTGDFIVKVTGHSFEPIPCVDAQGVPTGAEDCADTDRSFVSCTSSGCHGSADAARSVRAIAQTRIANLVSELNALLALVPGDQFSSDDDIFTSAEGAEFNAQLGEISSSAIHNPFMMEALLTSSIAHIKDFYGLPAQSAVSLDLQLDPDGY
jgi:predicted CXXCH cytochrome family protein